jgi:CRP/FNR family transcriptional regulator, anaerobic regulatory protein
MSIFNLTNQVRNTMYELELYIRNSFGALNPEEMRHVRTLFKYRLLAKGDYLLKSGRYCDSLAFVQSGLLRQFTLNDGREVTQWICSQGHFATDLASFIFESPARWTLQALSDTEVYYINRDDYRKIPSLVTRWHELEKIFLIRCFLTLEDRMFQHLSMSAEERYNAFFERNSALFNQVPLQHIASMLGMTPETFSRIRNRKLKS